MEGERVEREREGEIACGSRQGVNSSYFTRRKMPSYLLTSYYTQRKLGEVAEYAGDISTVIHRFGDRLSFRDDSAIDPFKARLFKGGWIYALRVIRFGLAVRR